MCIKKSDKDLPDMIIDPATLSISLDHQGIATLSVVVLTNTADSIPDVDFCKFKLGEDTTFRGYLISDMPQRFEGTDYFEHQMTARGAIC